MVDSGVMLALTDIRHGLWSSWANSEGVFQKEKLFNIQSTDSFLSESLVSTDVFQFSFWMKILLPLAQPFETLVWLVHSLSTLRFDGLSKTLGVNVYNKCIQCSTTFNPRTRVVWLFLNCLAFFFRALFFAHSCYVWRRCPINHAVLCQTACHLYTINGGAVGYTNLSSRHLCR